MPPPSHLHPTPPTHLPTHTSYTSTACRRYRLLLTGSAASGSVDDLMNHVAFLHPQYQTLEDLPGRVADLEDAQQVGAACRGWQSFPVYRKLHKS